MAMAVVDFHLHVCSYDQQLPSVAEFMRSWLGQDLKSYLDRVLTTEGLLALLDENGVDYAVALAEMSPITTGMTPNEYVAQLCQGSERLIPFANLNPYLVTNLAEELERCVRELGCRGLKLYPTYQHFYPNEAQLYPLYAKAQELGIPVMFHTGTSVFRGSRLKYGDPIYIDDVAVDFPHLAIVLAHSGRGFWYQQAFFLARLHPHVYMEVSGLPPQNLLAYFPDLERNADKIIFGSDWPGMPGIKQNIEAIRQLPLMGSTITKILGENAAKILRIGF